MRLFFPHGRLAAWADSHLLPGLLVPLLVTDVAVGINWLLSPARNLVSPAYDIAKLWQPMDTWGAMFIAAACAAASALAFGGRGRAGYVVLLPAGLWALWTVLFALAPLTRPGTSLIGAIFAGVLWVLHLLAGLAATHEHLTTASATVRG